MTHLQSARWGEGHLYIDAELKAKGLNVELLTQPTNSPDTNLLDLGFFMQCNLPVMNK